MNFVDVLTDVHFGRIKDKEIMKLAKESQSFTGYWLVHAIRSGCCGNELTWLLQHAKQTSHPLFSLLQKLLEPIIADQYESDSNKSERDDEINVLIEALTNKEWWLSDSRCLQDVVWEFETVHMRTLLNQVIASSTDHLKPVTVFGQDGRQKLSSVRNNKHFPTPLPNLSLEHALLERLMCLMADIDLGFAEPPVVLRYQPGEYYHWHYDYIDKTESYSIQQVNDFGQRVQTLLCFLNDEFSGGTTDFKELNISVKPVAGKIVKFANCDENGTKDSRSIHRGAEVASGEKWIITLWVRDKAFWLRQGLLKDMS